MPGELTPPEFVEKWKRVELSERAASQEHFIDLCNLLGQPTPASHDATGSEYTFEKTVPVLGPASRGSKGTAGFADVWWRGKFAWEYKRKDKHKDLTAAYRQLCQYREALQNPPLLIVSDIARTEIHTNFTGTAKEVHTVLLEDMTEPPALDLMRRVFTDPHSFRPETTPESITAEVAKQFGELAQALRDRGHEPHDTAHFLMKCMFCLFAEDVDLLPNSLFERLLKSRLKKPETLKPALDELFAHMRNGGSFGVAEIAHFNGGLFDESPALELQRQGIEILLGAAKQNWGSVEPAIFGTLFERSLDPNTRAQIGAHYTSREDIMLVVEPVVMAPLRREWDEVRANVEEQLVRRSAAKTKATKAKADKKGEKLLHDFVGRLASIRILDPACGSGNFLYVAIQQLLDLEKQVITYAAKPEIALGLFPQVRPTQLLGIEINPYAAELAQVVIWIGYLQWMRDHGFVAPADPILEPLQTIECRDAILDFLPVPASSSPEPPHSCGAEPAASPGRGGAYLLTWTSYGSWLPGDNRGFVGRVPDSPAGHVVHNTPGEPYDADDPRLLREAKRQRKGQPVRLSRDQAEVCAAAFHEVCDKYDLIVHAGAIMANHVHLVVTSETNEGAKLLNLFKGVSSRRLGQRFGRQPSGSWWTTGGSRRLLPDARALENAVDYLRKQEHVLATFASPASNSERPLPSLGVHSGRSAQRRDTPPAVDSGDSVVPPAMNGGARAVPARAVPATWPDADFIIGNPPFLGSALLRQQGLGDEYVQALFGSFDLPNTADLCCYWFEIARRRIELAPQTRIGFLATQGIRGGDNREVLRRIKRVGNIFMAWSDRDWILDGAAVHVSIVAFDGSNEASRNLDGLVVSAINSDLTCGADIASASPIVENAGVAFRGNQKGGAFDIAWNVAGAFLTRPNPNALSNRDVLRPYLNGLDVTRRQRGMWLIDYGLNTPIQDAAQYEAPFKHLEERVRPVRARNRRAHYRERWWIHNEPRPGMRAALESLSRYCVTPHVAKYVLVHWVHEPSLPDHQLIAFARSDDYFLGVLHNSIHELWARRMGTQLREAESGFRYTPTTCFETFPLPWSPGEEDTKHEAHGRISKAAKELNELREHWLNPPEWIEPLAAAVDAEDDFADVPEEARVLIRESAIMARAAKDPNLKKRTLTNLYNERPTWLRLAHDKLDRAVLAAYAAVDPDGEWSEDWAEVWTETGAGQPLPEDHELYENRQEIDQKVLANLLRMNLARAAAQSQ